MTIRENESKLEKIRKIKQSRVARNISIFVIFLIVAFIILSGIVSKNIKLSQGLPSKRESESNANSEINLQAEEKEYSLNVRNEYIKIGETLAVEVSEASTEVELSERDWTWTSSNEDVATISEDGIIEGKEIGSTTITGVNKTDGQKQKAIINVYRNIPGAITKPQAELGDGFTAVLKEEGTVWTAGINSSGQLGNGTTTNSNVPVQVKIDEDTYLTNVRKISVGPDYVIALTAKGEVYAWGNNGYGQLGTGDKKSSSYVVRMELAEGNYVENCVDISASFDAQTAVLTQDGKVYATGYNRYAGIPGSTTDRLYLTEIPSFSTAIKVSAGVANYATILQNGKTIIRGYNVSGQFGNGTNTADGVPGGEYEIGTDIDDISANGFSTTILKEDGTIWTTGKNTYGQLGLGDTTNRNVFTKIQLNGEDLQTKYIGKGNNSLTIIGKDEKTYFMGQNVSGQSSSGTVENIVNPTPIKDINEIEVNDAIYASTTSNYFNKSAKNTIIIKKNGTISIIGDNTYGQMGNGTKQSSKQLVKFGIDEIELNVRNEYIKSGDTLDIDVKKAGGFNVFIQEEIKQDDWTWESSNEDVATIDNNGNVTGKELGTTTIIGRNEQAGLKAKAIINVYRNVEGAVTLPQAEEGDGFTVVLKEDGTVWTSGYNAYGQLGNGTTTNSSIPVQVKIDENTYLTNVRKVSVGFDVAVAMTADGKVYGWGRNASGQLGTGDKKVYTYAIPLKNQDENMENVIDISCKNTNTIVLTSDGKVYGVGGNAYGIISDDLVEKNTFTEITSFDSSIKVVSDYSKSAVIKGNGTTIIRGHNPYGEFGNGTKATVGGVYEIGKDINNIAILGYTTAIVKEDGTLWRTGLNDCGQLGVGDTTTRTTFTEVKINEKSVNVKNIGGGTYAMMFTTKDGKTYYAGQNAYGQSTDGTTKNALIPVQMKNADGTELINPICINASNYNYNYKARNSVIIRENGTVGIVGDNSYGQMGNGTNQSSNQLVKFGIDETELNVRNEYIKIGDTLDIDIKEAGGFNVFIEEENSQDDWTWKSSNEDVATIDNDGVVTGKEIGTTTITGKNEKLELKAKAIVNVYRNVDGAITMPQIEQGDGFTAILKEDGTVWTAGLNDKGQLGNGTTTNSNVLTQVKINENTYLTNVRKISVGLKFAMAMTTDGKVYSWGDNEYGQLAIGETSNKNYATMVKTETGNIKNAIDIDGRYLHSTILLKDGKVFSAGYNGYGQITDDNKTKTVMTEILSFNSGIKVSAEYCVNAVLKSNGDTLIRGENANGAFGNGKTEMYGGEYLIGNDINDIYTFGYSTAIIKEDNTVWTTGYNHCGQLGLGNTKTQTVFTKVEVNGEPLKAKYIKGGGYSLTITGKDEKIYYSGQNTYGQSTNGTVTNVLTPITLKYLTGIEVTDAIYATASNNRYTEPVRNLILLKQDGTVWVIGDNTYGQMAQGDNVSRNVLTQIGETAIFSPVKYQYEVAVKGTTQIDLSNFIYENEFNVFVDGGEPIGKLQFESLNPEIAQVDIDTGEVIGVSEGTARIQVTNTANNDVTYVTVKVTTGEIAPAVAGGYRHTLALKQDGTVWSFGMNSYGQLGNNKLSGKYVTEPVEVLKEDGSQLDNIKMVSASVYSSAALSKDGEVYTWGYNAYGELGNGTNTNNVTPTKVNIPTKIVKIATWQYRMVALDENGDVWVWGQNFKNTPQKLQTVEKVVDITGQIYLTESKRVYNVQNGKTVVGLENVVELSSNYPNNNFALRADGKVYSWGDNRYGQLGDGTTVAKTTPVFVKNPEGTGELEDIVEISSNIYSVTARNSKGEVYTWGYNKYGELGLNSNTNQKLPVKVLEMQDGQEAVTELPKIETIAEVNGYHKILVDTEGYVWTTGFNDYGQLGNKTLVNGKVFAKIGEPYIETSEGNITLAVGETKDVTAKAKNGFNLKTDEIDVPLKYEILDEEIATVEGITVEAKQEGKTYLVISNEELGISTTIEIEILPEGAKALADVQAGAEYTIALKQDGTVWSWGLNNYGQLGTGDIANKIEPTKVEGIDAVAKQISTEDNHTLVLTENREVYSFGYNYYGQCANGGRSNVTVPNKVKTLEAGKAVPLTNIVKVKAGKNVSFAIDTEFNLWAWGQGYGVYAKKLDNFNRVIDVTKDYVLKSDGKVYKLSDEIEVHTEKEVKTLDEGFDHTVMIAKDNTAYSIGKNEFGQLGTGNNTDSIDVVVAVRNPSGEDILGNVKQIRAGKQNTIAITKDNKVYVWGSNENGKLGQEDTILDKNLPFEYTKVATPSIVTVGYNHTSIAKQDGFVYSFGKGELGQLGDRKEQDSQEPVVAGIYRVKADVTSITVNKNSQKKINAQIDYFNLIKNGGEELEYTSYDNEIATVDSDGTVTGIEVGKTTIEIKRKNNTEKIVIPVEVTKEGQIAIPQVKTNGSHTIILKADGTVYSFGQNANGELGDRSYETKDGAVQVAFDKVTKITQIDAGLEHNIALDTAGNVWTWGNNNYGQLGVSGRKSNVPVQVKMPERIVKISAGNNFSLAIGESGKAYGWGSNTNGELGIGTYRNTSYPTEIIKAENVIDISGGNNHSILVTNEGKVYTTGINTYGQLGYDEIKTNKFTEVPTLSDISEVEAGDTHNVAITVARDVYTWGGNIYGQLGLGDRENRATPVKVEGKTHIQEVSAGKANTMMLENTGKIYITGANNEGELGDGTKEGKLNYIEIGKISDATSITTGNTYSLAIRKDGSVWAWGDYNHGQTDLKSKTNSEIPVKIATDLSLIQGIQITLRASDTDTLKINERYEFNVYKSYDKEPEDFTYESLNPEIATINAEGTILGIRPGTTKVIATDKETEEKTVAIVKVIENTNKVASKVESGEGFSVGLKGDGSIWTWGENEELLGNTDNETKAEYKGTLIPEKTNIISTYKDISVGKNFSLALREDGTVWALGENSKGQLGTEDTKDSTKLVQTHKLEEIKMIAGGEDHSVAVDKYGIIYGWGNNENGALGDIIKGIVPVPTVIGAPEDNVMNISAGKDETAYVTMKGEVYGLGNILNGKIEGISNAIKVEVGNGFILILTQEGTMYEYSNGGLKQIPGEAIDISVQNEIRMYQDKAEDVYVWGTNTDGELGTNDTANKEVPTKVAQNGENTFGIGAGYNNSYIIVNNGLVYASGKNDKGQIGNSTTQSSNAHILVGDREFSIEPENKTMMINDVEEIQLNNKVFNMFNNKKKDITQYDFESLNPDIVELSQETAEEGQERIIMTAKQEGTATIKAIDKLTGEEKEATRIVIPIEEQRFDTITVDGINANLVENKKYAVEIKSDKDVANLKIVTKDITDKISIDNGVNYTENGTLTTEIPVTEKVTTLPIKIQIENGTILDYELEITKRSKNIDLLSLTVNGQEALPRDTRNYEIVVEEDVQDLNIQATTSDLEAEVKIADGEYTKNIASYPKTMEGIEEKLPIVVKSESGTIATYMLTIYKKSTVIDLSNLTVNGEKATRTSETEYNITVPQDTLVAEVVATSQYESALVKIGNEEEVIHIATSNIVLNEEQTEVKIEVKAEMETEEYSEEISREYKLKINKEKENAKIDVLTVNETPIEEVNNAYIAYIPNTANSAEVRVVTVLDTDKIEIIDKTQEEKLEGIHDFKANLQTPEKENTYTIVITDVNTKEVRQYTLIIKKSSTDTSLKSLIGKTDEEEFTANLVKGTDDTYELKVPVKVNEIMLEAITQNENAMIGINNGELVQNIAEETITLSAETTKVTIRVQADDETEKTYTLNIIKEIGDVSLEEITVNGVQATKLEGQEDIYEIQLTETLTEAEVKAVTTDTEASLYIESGEYQLHEATKTVLLESRIVEVPIVVKSKEGYVKEYTLKIKGLPDNTNVVFTIDEKEAEYIPEEGKYILKINKNVEIHTLEAVLEDSNAKIQLGNNLEEIGSSSMTITNDMIGSQIEATITAQDGKTKETVILEIAEMSAETGIEYVKVNNEELIADETGNYAINVKHNVNTANIDIKTIDKYATIVLEGIPGVSEEVSAKSNLKYDLDLNTLTNEAPTMVLTIKIIAEDGTEKTQNLTITKQDGNANLTSITVDGNIVTPDEQGVYHYVIARKDTATVVATAENKKSIVTIDGTENSTSSATKAIDTLGEETTVNILVTSEDGTAKLHELILRKISNDTVLQSLSIEGLDGDLKPTGENTYVAELPFEMQTIDLTGITRSPYASIKLKEEDDSQYNINKMTRKIEITEFKQDISIIVKAEDGTLKEYILTVIRAHSLDIDSVKANEDIIKLDEETQSYNGFFDAKDTTNITITTKDETTKIELLQGEEVLQEATGELQVEVETLGDTVDLSFRVTMEDNSETKTYPIHLQRKSTDNTIEYLKLDETEIEQVEGGYSKIVDRKNSYVLNIKPTNEYAQIKIDDGQYFAPGEMTTNLNMTNIEEKVYTITVKSQNGEEQTYPLNIRKISDDTSLKIVQVDDQDAFVENGNYVAFVERDAQTAHVKVETTNELAKVEILELESETVDDETLTNTAEKDVAISQEDEITTVKIRVIAENGDEKLHTLLLTKESQNNNIVEVKVNEQTTTLRENGEYQVNVVDTLEEVSVYVKAENKYAQIQINSDPQIAMGENTVEVPLNEIDKTQKFEIKVTAQDGTEKTYTLAITRQNNDNTVQRLTVDDVEVLPEGNIYEKIVEETAINSKVNITANNANSKIKFGDQEAMGNLEIDIPVEEAFVEHTFEVTSEYGTKATYKLKIRKKSNDASIKSITVNEIQATKDDDGNYKVEILDNTQTGNIRVETSNQYVKVRIGTGEEQTHIGTERVELIEKETNVVITTTSETGVREQVVLKILKMSNDTSIEIVAVDDTDVTEYNARTHTYEITLDKLKESYNLSIVTKNKEATITVGEESSKNTINVTIPVAGDGKEVTFTVTAENGAKQEYTLIIRRVSDNANAGEVQVNDVEVLPTNPESGIYEKIIPKLAETAKVRVKSEYGYSKVKIGDAEEEYGESTIELPLSLEEDKFTIPVVITASDEETIKTYNIVLIRGNNDTNITTVQVEGEVIPYENEKYSATVKGGLTEARVTIELADQNATVELEGQTGKGRLTAKVPLENVPQTLKTIKVTAEDGTRKDYVLEINKLVSISGKVTTENFEGKHTATVQIYKTSDKRPIDDEINPRELIAEAQTNEDGTFDILVPEISEYDVIITKPGYLSHTVTNITTEVGKTSNIGEKKLIAGDVVESGQIEIDDLVNIVDHYGEVPDETLEPDKYIKESKYDLNEDGIIDSEDRAIIKKNYDKTDVVEIWENPEFEKQSTAKEVKVENGSENKALNGDNAQNSPKSTQTPNEKGFIKPIEGKYTITSEYGTRTHPVTGVTKKHTGIDIGGEHHTNIYAVAEGEVTFAGVQNGFGNCIEIKHIVNGETIYSFYAHLSRIDVQAGEKVSQGQVIGLEGGDPETDPNPGSSTGHHLHFEIRNASGYGNDVDPTNYIVF